MAKKEEEIISQNPWLDKEYKQGLPLFTREPGLEIDDLPERLGLLDEVTTRGIIEATKFTELADTSSDYGLDKQFPMSDGEGIITWDYPYWKPSGSSIYFKKRVSVGHSHPMTEFHVYKPQTKVQARIGAKENPWVEWESTKENNGFAAGIADAANKLFKINYDSPIGTASQLFLCLDAGNTRIGAYTASPQVSYHIKKAACSGATYNAYTVLCVEDTDNAAIQISSGTDGFLLFCDEDSNPAPGQIEYDHASEYMRFIAGGNVLVEILGASSPYQMNTMDGIRLAVGDVAATNAFHVEDAGTTGGWGGSYGGVMARFRCTESKHTSVVVDALTGYDPVLGFCENAIVVWSIRNDASVTDKFQIRYHLGGANSTAFQIDNAGHIQIGRGVDGVDYTLTFNGYDNDGVITWMEDEDYFLFGDGIVMADGESISLQEDITFTGATTENLIKIPDHLAVALDITEASNSYLKFVTTNSGEKAVFGKLFEAPTACKIGNLTLADGSITDSGGSIAFGDENLSTTGTLNVATNTLSVGEVANSVGIGTAAPGGPLHVFKSGGADVPCGSIILNRYLSAGSWRGGAIFNYYPTSAAQDVLAFAVSSDTTPLDIAKVKMIVGANGRIGIGLVNPDSLLHVATDGFLPISFESASNTVFYRPDITLIRSRGTMAAKTVVAENDFVGLFQFRVHDGGDTASVAAEFGALVDGSVAASDTPGRLIFGTTPAGSNVPTERMRITTTGNVGINQTTFGTNAANVFALGTGVAPTTSPVNCFQMYSADIGGVAYEAGAHFRDELGLLTILGDGGCVFDKTAGKGIKIDTSTPTFGWRDLLGQIRTRGVGSDDPNDATYSGNIKAYKFSVGDECWVDYHIPHDYVPGTDIFLHFHWSHNSADVTGGSVTWGADVTYAKGHDQAAFPAEINTTVVGNASTTQYQHIITEIQLSASTPSGSQIDTDDLEPDGVIMIRGYLSANNITSGNGVPDPFLHFKDIHYQSTNIATKDKVPDFYS